MKTKIFFLAVGTLLSITGSICAQKEPYYKPKQAEVINAAEFRVMKPERRFAPCRKSLKQCAFDAMATVGLEGFGGPETIYFFENQFDYRRGGKRVGVFLFSILSREDEPWVDERTRVEFERVGTNWRLVTIGQQSRCGNSRRMTSWSKRKCG